MAEKLHQQQKHKQGGIIAGPGGGGIGGSGNNGSGHGGGGGGSDGDGQGHHHLSSPQEYSCEICGASGFTDELMRDHTRTCHVEGNAQCPFCGLSGIASAELLLHVNQAHLDYLTPDNELMNFIDDQSPSTYFSIDGDSDSISECRGLSPSITEIPGLINNNSNINNHNNHHHNINNNNNNAIDNNYVNHNNNNINDNYNINNYKYNNNNNSPLHSNDNHQCLNRNINNNNKQYQMTNTNYYQNETNKKAHQSSGIVGPATSISTTSSSSLSAVSSNNRSSNTIITRPMNQLCSIQSSSSSTSSSTISSLSSSSATSLPNCDYHTNLENNCTEEKTIVERQNGSQGSPLRSQLGLNLKSHAKISPITFVTTIATTTTTQTTTSTSSSNTTKSSKPIQSPLQCPLCPYTSDRANVLEEHINRLHFDPLSPSLNSSFIAGGGAASSSSLTSSVIGNNNNNNITTNHSNTLNAFGCPLCVRTFESASDLELHVNIEHKDILSPAKIDRNETVFEQFNGGNVNDNDEDDDDDDDDNDDADGDADNRRGNGGARAQLNATKIVNDQKKVNKKKSHKNLNNQSNYCPICNILLDTMNTQEMELHIEGHFSKSPTYLTTKELTANGKQIEFEKEAQKLREQREFEMLRAQYGMDDQGNFREQSAAAMQRAVYAGEMSVADYYERQVGLRAAESHGIDDSTSCTKSVVARVHTLSSTSPAIVRTLLCSAVDHYASSYGDKGWGCGYRNLQMILSSLLQNTTFNEALYSAWGKQGPSRTAMPSISRLQKMVEAAWTQGFDVQGSEQLGCKLYNTRKWIGATEVLTVLSWLRINCQLIDFHRPTASDGRHPELFNWVLRYFDEPKIHTPPLYLQHQGHSRTIIGIEQRVSGLTLLVLDPSHGPRQVAALGASQESLRLIRRGSSAMRAPQYQIVAVKGLIDTEEQYQASKVLRSIRIPSDC